MESDDDASISLKRAIADEEKWGITDWEMRSDWIAHLERFHGRLLDDTASYEQVDLFWVKLWGLIDEFVDPMKRLGNLVGCSYTLHQNHENLAMKQIFHSYRERYKERTQIIAQNIASGVVTIQSIKKRFSNEECLFILDFRTHICHPVAGYYRLSVDKSGNLKDVVKGRSKIEVQEILAKIWTRYQIKWESLGKSGVSRFVANDFAKRIKARELADVRGNIDAIVHQLRLI